MENAECPICFEPLPSTPVSVLAMRGRRVCRHFFHERCGEAMKTAAGGMHCPICRETYDGLLRVPDVMRDPHGWFKLVDLDGNGALDATEVSEVLKATLSVDVRRLDQDLPLLLPQWDGNGDGRVEFNEMMGPHGLFYYVRDAFRATGQAPKDIPDIRSDRREWFRYWDEDGSGALDQEEVIRSFVKTFSLGSDVAQVQFLREIVGALWSEFDPDNSGEIDMDEFCRPGEGLADMVIANVGAL